MASNELKEVADPSGLDHVRLNDTRMRRVGKDGFKVTAIAEYLGVRGRVTGAAGTPQAALNALYATLRSDPRFEKLPF